MTTNLKTWRHIFNPRPKATSRLVCFHYAGGAAGLFRKWSMRLPEHIEVWAIQLPGRWERSSEPFLKTVDAAVEQINGALKNGFDGPFAVVGFSLGAVIGFEWIRRLRKDDLKLPTRFFALSRGAPQLPPLYSSIHSLPEPEFLKQMKARYFGMPAQIFDDPEVRDVFSRVLRADMQIFETYVHRKEAPLNVPFTVISGSKDTTCKKEHMLGWSEQTSAPLDSHVLDGGHFFTPESELQILSLVAERIET